MFPSVIPAVIMICTEVAWLTPLLAVKPNVGFAWCRAVTSSGSAELIAVSSLFTYDGYWHYINPRATGKQLLIVSKIMILCYTVLMGKPSAAIDCTKARFIESAIKARAPFWHAYMLYFHLLGGQPVWFHVLLCELHCSLLLVCLFVRLHSALAQEQ